ncbi:MAG: DNA polymerase III subunit delta' [Sulfuricellaceae bacterium]|nr:DNA polymerase III subunit delta' [Sulfuricellaceae bacterium]
MSYFPWQQSLWQQINRDRSKLPHALLFSGRKGIGKLAFARALAQGLLCEAPQPEGEACGSCLACGWFAQGNHPDFRLVEPEILSESEADAEPKSKTKGKKPSKQILIEQIRLLSELVNLSSHRNGMRVILIHPAEAMNLASANALLKTLEEPPPRTVIILVSHQIQSLLPTVRSRCLKIAFPLPSFEQGASWLAGQGMRSPESLLAQAGNAPLAALDLADEEIQAARRSLLSQLASPQAFDPVTWAEKNEKQDLPSLVKWLQQWVYDLLACHMGTPLRYQLDYQAEIRVLASRLNLSEALGYQQTLLGAQKNVHHPLNAQLFLEQLLLSYADMFESGLKHG